MKKELHPLRDQELAWTEQMPVPTVYCNINLASSGLEVDFNTQQFVLYARSLGIKNRKISDLEVYITDDTPDEARFSLLSGLYERDINSLTIDAIGLYSERFSFRPRWGESSLEEEAAELIASETKRMKDKSRIIQADPSNYWVRFSGISAALLGIYLEEIGIDDADFLTNVGSAVALIGTIFAKNEHEKKKKYERKLLEYRIKEGEAARGILQVNKARDLL